MVKDQAPDPHTPRKRKTRHSNNPPVEQHVGWIMDVREHRIRTTSTGSSFGTSPNENNLGTSVGSVPQALPTFQHPSHALLKENNFTQQAYHKFRQKCLKGASLNQFQSGIILDLIYFCILKLCLHVNLYYFAWFLLFYRTQTFRYRLIK